MRRISFKSKYVLSGTELRPIEDGVVDVNGDGVIIGIGKVPGSSNVVDLGSTVLMPQLVNAHVHVLDYVLLGLYGMYYIDDLVGAPYGLKYQVLRKMRKEDLIDGLRGVFRRIRRYGVGCMLTIIEYGTKFTEAVVEEAGKEGLCVIPFAEPSTFRVYVREDEEGDVHEEFEHEIKLFVNKGFNVSLVSPLNYTTEELRLAARITAMANRWIMTHVSETEDTYADNDLARALSTLDLGNTIMVHMTQLSDDDLARLSPLPLVVCPRSNVELVGKLPRITTMVKLGFRVMVGTDNVALIEPNPWDEIKALKALLRYSGHVVNDVDLLRMVTTWPRYWGFGFSITGGEVFKAVVIGLGYNSINTNNLIHYLIDRVSPNDIVGLIDGTMYTRFS